MRALDQTVGLSRAPLVETTRWVSVVLFVILFTITSIDKWLHFGQFLNAVHDYVLVPSGFAQSVALLVASLEGWLAVGFIVPLWRRTAAGIASVMLSVFALAMLVNYHFGVLASCGCWFSVTLNEAGPLHIIFDIFLAGLAITIWFEEAKGSRTDAVLEQQKGV